MKKFLLMLALLSCLIPAKAEATTTAGVSCNAQVSLRDGARISYQISGQVELSDAGQLIPPPEPNLFVTIRRRERNGQERVLVNRRQLGYFETIAPDADYSLLPFTGNFKAAPNNGSGIYYVPSAAHGIYVSLIPRETAPARIQIVHYLSRSNFARSTPARCTLQTDQ